MKNSKKIVFFHPYFSDGGVERTNIGLAKGLIKSGYDVVFVTISPSEHFLEEVLEFGIQWVVLSARSTLRSQIEFSRWIRLEKKSSCRLVIISCQYYVNLACLLFRPLWGSGVRHILSERNHLDEFLIHRSIKRKLIAKMVSLFYKYADVVIANSAELARDLSKVTKRSVGIVYNPTVNERLFQLGRQEVREPWFDEREGPVIIAVGRLSAQKDFSTLLKAFALLRQTNNARLLILGDGAERSSLMKLAEELDIVGDLTMPGFVSNPYKFIRHSSLFVLSSAYEGLPNVLIEALAIGVPVVSTSCRSGPTEILLGGKIGELVPVAGVNELSEAMRRSLDGLIVRPSLEAIEESLARFTPENSVSQLVSILKKM